MSVNRARVVESFEKASTLAISISRTTERRCDAAISKRIKGMRNE
jgi:hypothetical protein